jgi:hypothetical protein
MPVLTPNYSLPVPGALDEPCDFPEQWCAFTDATQAVLDGFEAIANRTNPWVPVAKMELRTTVTIPADSAIPFDTLTLNNAGMVDFDNNNTSIIINRPGRFFAVLNVLFAFSTVANSYFNAQFLPSGSGSITRTLSLDHNLNIGAINVGSTLSAVIYVTTPPVVYRTNIELIGAGAAATTIDLAALSLFWFADGATP